MKIILFDFLLICAIVGIFAKWTPPDTDKTTFTTFRSGLSPEQEAHQDILNILKHENNINHPHKRLQDFTLEEIESARLQANVQKVDMKNPKRKKTMSKTQRSLSTDTFDEEESLQEDTPDQQKLIPNLISDIVMKALSKMLGEDTENIMPILNDFKQLIEQKTKHTLTKHNDLPYKKISIINLTPNGKNSNLFDELQTKYSDNVAATKKGENIHPALNDPVNNILNQFNTQLKYSDPKIVDHKVENLGFNEYQKLYRALFKQDEGARTDANIDVKYAAIDENTKSKSKVDYDSFKKLLQEVMGNKLNTKVNQSTRPEIFRHRSKRQTQAGYTQDPETCKKYNDNLNKMWASLSKYLNYTDSVNEIALHNIAVMVEAYLDHKTKSAHEHPIDVSRDERKRDKISEYLRKIKKMLGTDDATDKIKDIILENFKPEYDDEEADCKQINEDNLVSSIAISYQNYLDNAKCHGDYDTGLLRGKALLRAGGPPTKIDTKLTSHFHDFNEHIHKSILNEDESSEFHGSRIPVAKRSKQRNRSHRRIRKRSIRRRYNTKRGSSRSSKSRSSSSHKSKNIARKKSRGRKRTHARTDDSCVKYANRKFLITLRTSIERFMALRDCQHDDTLRSSNHQIDSDEDSEDADRKLIPESINRKSEDIKPSSEISNSYNKLQNIDNKVLRNGVKDPALKDGDSDPALRNGVSGPILRTTNNNLTPENTDNKALSTGVSDSELRNGDSDPALRTTDNNPTPKNTDNNATLSNDDSKSALRNGANDPALRTTDNNPTLENTDNNAALRNGISDPALTNNVSDPVLRTTDNNPTSENTENNSTLINTNSNLTLRDADGNPSLEITDSNLTLRNTDSIPSLENNNELRESIDSNPLRENIDDKSETINNDTSPEPMITDNKTPILRVPNERNYNQLNLYSDIELGQKEQNQINNYLSQVKDFEGQDPSMIRNKPIFVVHSSSYKKPMLLKINNNQGMINRQRPVIVQYPVHTHNAQSSYDTSFNPQVSQHSQNIDNVYKSFLDSSNVYPKTTFFSSQYYGQENIQPRQKLRENSNINVYEVIKNPLEEQKNNNTSINIANLTTSAELLRETVYDTNIGQDGLKPKNIDFVAIGDILNEVRNTSLQTPQIDTVSIASESEKGYVELSYLVKYPKSIVYRPQYLVKNILQYEDFVKVAGQIYITDDDKQLLKIVRYLPDNTSQTLFETQDLISPFEIRDVKPKIDDTQFGAILSENIDLPNLRQNPSNETDFEVANQTETEDNSTSATREGPSYEDSSNIDLNVSASQNPYKYAQINDYIPYQDDGGFNDIYKINESSFESKEMLRTNDNSSLSVTSVLNLTSVLNFDDTDDIDERILEILNASLNSAEFISNKEELDAPENNITLYNMDDDSIADYLRFRLDNAEANLSAASHAYLKELEALGVSSSTLTKTMLRSWWQSWKNKLNTKLQTIRGTVATLLKNLENNSTMSELRVIPTQQSEPSGDQV